MQATLDRILTVDTADLEVVAVDIYRNVHKGIRSELFAITTAAGNVAPTDTCGVERITQRWSRFVPMLESHAAHEDRFLQPLIEKYAPEIAAVIAETHPVLEAKVTRLAELGVRAAAAPASQRRLALHRFYLGVASFTAEYLQHQEFEELQAMPALSRAIGADELQIVEHDLVASIPPDEIAAFSALMIPAMNLEDRVEMLGGMQAGAPPEVFAGMMALTQSVIAAADYTALATRLGVA
jgi:hypothetical protein